MSDSPEWPFDVLGLDTSGPDKGQVRKAYARLVKKIDQSADPAGFQNLRQAYEAALFRVESPATEDIEVDDGREGACGAGHQDDVAVGGLTHFEAHGPEPSALSASVAELVQRVSEFTAPETDVDRLISILDDPLMTNPIVADAVEQEIYYFLFDRIYDESVDYPGFALRGSSGFTRNPPESHRLPELIDRLDETFGWMSDQVRMQGRFIGFEQFFFAATYLGRRRMSPPPKAASGVNWGVVWPLVLMGILFLANVVPQLVDPRRPDIAPPSYVQFGADEVFLFGSGSMEPSAETVQFLHDLADEQSFSDKAKKSVSLIIARNWANRAIKGDRSWMSHDGYSNLDELKYMTGVMLSAMLQMQRRFGYRNTSDFSLSWNESKKVGLWRNIGDGTLGQRLWGEGGGYMIAAYQSPDDATYRAVYPAEYVDSVMAATGRDPRALEGAFGLKVHTLGQSAPVRFHFYESVTFSRVIGEPVDIGVHYLSKTGLGENRWPIRATTLPKESCRLMTVTAGHTHFANRC